MIWTEVIRKLKAAGFVDVRSGKGSHRLLKHPTTGKEVWVAVHTKKDRRSAGRPHLARGRCQMTIHYPIVLETEASGAVSAYVPGLPVYAAADSHAEAERVIRAMLRAYLEAHPGSRSAAQVRVARFSGRPKNKVDIVGVAALVGARRSAVKAQAARANGRLGGRPRKSTTKARRAKSAR